MATQALQRPLNPNAVKTANSKISAANTPEEKQAWIAEYQTALKKINNKNSQLKNSGSKAGNKTGSTKTTQNCKPKSCSKSIMTIEGSVKRQFKLELPDPTPLNATLIQVLGGITDDSGTNVKVLYSGGKCTKNAKDCSRVTITGPQSINETFKSKKEIKLYSDDPVKNDPWSETLMPFKFFTSKVLFPSKIPSQTYNVSTSGCSKHSVLNANIEVITPVSWGGTFTWGWEKVPWKRNQFKTKKNERVFKFGGKIKGKYGEKSFNVGFEKAINGSPSNFIEWILDIGDKLRKSLSFLDDINKQLGKEPTKARIKKFNTAKLKSGMTPEIKFEIKWPKFEFDGEYKNIEISKQYMVAHEGTLKIAANPLFGAAVHTDVLDWIAALWPPILKFKKLAAEGTDSEYFGAKAIISVILGIEGDLTGQFEVKYNAHGPIAPEGSIGCSLNFILKGEVYAEGRFWKVSVGAGASISMRSALNTSENPGLRGKLAIGLNDRREVELKGEVFFTGIKIFGAAYAYFGVKIVKTKKTTTTSPRGGSSQTKSITKAKDLGKYEERIEKEVYDLVKPKAIYPSNLKLT